MGKKKPPEAPRQGPSPIDALLELLAPSGITPEQLIARALLGAIAPKPVGGKVKGADVRAMREVLRLLEKRQQGAGIATTVAKPTVAQKAGRPQRKVDLEKITELARLGFRDISKIAMLMGIPKQTLLGPVHAESVRKAFEMGRALDEMDALQAYNESIANGRFNAAQLFEMKQFGWTDRPLVGAPGGVGPADAQGAKERLLQLIHEKQRLMDANVIDVTATATNATAPSVALPASVEGRDAASVTAPQVGTSDVTGGATQEAQEPNADTQ